MGSNGVGLHDDVLRKYGVGRNFPPQVRAYIPSPSHAHPSQRIVGACIAESARAG